MGGRAHVGGGQDRVWRLSLSPAVELEERELIYELLECNISDSALPNRISSDLMFHRRVPHSKQKEYGSSMMPVFSWLAENSSSDVAEVSSSGDGGSGVIPLLSLCWSGGGIARARPTASCPSRELVAAADGAVETWSPPCTPCATATTSTSSMSTCPHSSWLGIVSQDIGRSAMCATLQFR